MLLRSAAALLWRRGHPHRPGPGRRRRHPGGGLRQRARHLNSAVQSGVATGVPAAQIFASPLRFDKDWNPEPYLAETWSFQDDGRSVLLKIRAGATFHDGKPITSEDVAFSIMTIKANHPFQSMFAPVERVDTPTPQIAIIRLSAPHPAILLALSPPFCPIIPKHVFGDGQDLKTHPPTRCRWGRARSRWCRSTRAKPSCWSAMPASS
jgi:peptide/nickel transport system substrate-binding protein